MDTLISQGIEAILNSTVEVLGINMPTLVLVIPLGILLRLLHKVLQPR